MPMLLCKVWIQFDEDIIRNNQGGRCLIWLGSQPGRVPPPSKGAVGEILLRVGSTGYYPPTHYPLFQRGSRHLNIVEANTTGCRRVVVVVFYRIFFFWQCNGRLSTHGK